MNNLTNVPRPPPPPPPPPLSVTTSKPKKRSRNPDSWKENVIKNAKIHGKLHRSYDGQIVSAKQMNDVNCLCAVQCNSRFSQQQKDKIFDEYYALENHTEQNLYLRGQVLATPGGRNQYFLKVNGQAERVCQLYFLAIHSIKKSRLRNKVTNRHTQAKDMRGKHDNRPKVQQAPLTAVRQFLNGLDARESHYSRSKNSNKKYLESSTSVASLYSRFIECNPGLDPNNANNPPLTHVKFWLFEKIFNFEFNLSFGYPRSDLCEKCEQFHVKKKAATPNSVEMEQLCLEQEEHWFESNQFYDSMKSEKLNGLPPNEFCICFDFEKNLPLPVTNVTAEYFLSQLWLYNFCVHNLRTADSKMFVYAENFAQKGCNEVISCLMFYIQHYIPQNFDVLNIWCDNSFAQNKNRYLVATLLSLCGNRFKEIKMKFPIPGHSRMRCDKDFALIKKQKLKNDKFSYPSDWIKLIKTAKLNPPFDVIYVQNSLTDDLTDDNTPVVPVMDFKSSLDPVLRPPDGINQIRGIRMNQQGTIFKVLTTYGTLETPFALLKPGITSQNLVTRVQSATHAYNGYLKLKPQKLVNIRKLLEFVNQPDDKIFYETLEL